MDCICRNFINTHSLRIKTLELESGEKVNLELVFFSASFVLLLGIIPKFYWFGLLGVGSTYIYCKTKVTMRRRLVNVREM
jgi:hypothetical protein